MPFIDSLEISRFCFLFLFELKKGQNIMAPAVRKLVMQKRPSVKSTHFAPFSENSMIFFKLFLPVILHTLCKLQRDIVQSHIELNRPNCWPKANYLVCRLRVIKDHNISRVHYNKKAIFNHYNLTRYKNFLKVSSRQR